MATIDFSMLKSILVLANPKGGTGKTTGAYNLASALVKKGLRVLLIDIDEQGSLGRYAVAELVRAEEDPSRDLPANQGISALMSEKNIYQLLIGAARLSDSTIATPVGDLIAAHPKIPKLAGMLVDDPDIANRLGEQLPNADYDYVIIDTPGRLGFELTLALRVAETVIMPVMPADSSLESLGLIQDAIKRTGGAERGVRLNLLPIGFRKIESHEQFFEELHEIEVPLLPTIGHDESVKLRTEAGFQLDPRSNAFKQFELAAEGATA